MTITPKQQKEIDTFVLAWMSCDPAHRSELMDKMIDCHREAMLSLWPEWTPERHEAATIRFAETIQRRLDEIKNSGATDGGHA